MITSKDISGLSEAEKQERIQQLEAELDILYQSVAKSENSPNLVSPPDHEQQQGILNHMSDAVIIYGVDSIITSWNPAATAMVGYTQQEALGQKIEDLLQSMPIGSTQQDVGAQLLAQGQWQGDVVYQHKEGHEMIAWTSANMLQAESDESATIVSVLREITKQHFEKQELQQQLYQFEDLYQVFYSIPDIVFMLNPDFGFMFANQALADWFKIPIGKIQGQNILTLLPNFKQSVFYQNYKESMVDRQPRSIVAQYDAGEANPDDQQWYESRIFPVGDGILVIARDITHQREVDAQLLEYELANARMQMLDEVVHSLAHDLRTPLSVLHTSLHLLERYTDPEKQQRKLVVIKRQVSILEKMIENILLLTELDVYNPADLAPSDVIQIVESAVQMLQSRANTKNQALTLNVPQQPIDHLVNPDHLRRAIGNIIENAILYTPEQGTIDVSVQANSSDTFQIIITDTGYGIVEDELPHIFERFYRINQARTVNEASNGLGLSIAKEIVELHHGTIAVISEPNQGTEITIRV